MTGPNDPDEPPSDDWGFPEVDPTSTRLPAEPEDSADEEPVYDTGSDAWWRAQAEAQRRAAAAEPPVPAAEVPSPPPAEPPPLTEPTVLNAPSPLDESWLPPELPQLRAPEPTDHEPEGSGTDWGDSPHDGDDEDHAHEDVDPSEAPDAPPSDGPDWFRGLVDTADPAAAMPAEVPPEVEPVAGEREPLEPQRVGPARAVAGAALALLGVLLAIGALVLFNGNDEPKGGPTVAFTPNGLGTTTAAPSATPSTEASPTAVTTTAPAVVSTTPAAAPMVPVSVLNNSRIHGLADRAARRFRAGGWTVATTGNYRGLISTTTVYYVPGQQASAERFARQFGIPRVAPRFAGIPVQGMTVILTRDYAP